MTEEGLQVIQILIKSLNTKINRELEKMPIMNKSKIRPDVLKIVDELQKVQIEGISEFLGLEEK